MVRARAAAETDTSSSPSLGVLTTYLGRRLDLQRSIEHAPADIDGRETTTRDTPEEVPEADRLRVLSLRPIHVRPVRCSSPAWHLRVCARSWSLVIVKGRSWSGFGYGPDDERLNFAIAPGSRCRVGPCRNPSRCFEKVSGP